MTHLTVRTGTGWARINSKRPWAVFCGSERREDQSSSGDAGGPTPGVPACAERKRSGRTEVEPAPAAEGQGRALC
ncbi:hypothetical protein NDU88_004530 [Pleurodeles waltl]|uniref:Uncharacterized protein n=1 Tax=Pleurodeles waltl TaxID=8319 RepID=A0AAV7T8R8_PLEWA|nr:hypothetical protein NDU88_004530 [Pleurodeles waltl]